jgi:hypothetical protein
MNTIIEEKKNASQYKLTSSNNRLLLLGPMLGGACNDKTKISYIASEEKEQEMTIQRPYSLN